MNLNKAIRTAYLDYVNDYLTVERWAEAYGIPIDYAASLIDLGKILQDTHAELWETGLVPKISK